MGQYCSSLYYLLTTTYTCTIDKSFTHIRQWYTHFHNVIMLNDFIMIDKDYHIYMNKSKDKFIILSLHVNDILIARNNSEYANKIKG